MFPGDSIIEQHRKRADRTDAVIARVVIATLDGDMRLAASQPHSLTAS